MPGDGRGLHLGHPGPKGTLLVTEASSKKRASLHVVRGDDALRAHDPGGLEVLDADLERFRDALVRESHTIKRALTDPRLFSGIGNAYSDEILHAARLSPVKLTRSLTEDEVQRLFDATQRTLLEGIRKTGGVHLTSCSRAPGIPPDARSPSNFHHDPRH